MSLESLPFILLLNTPIILILIAITHTYFVRKPAEKNIEKAEKNLEKKANELFKAGRYEEAIYIFDQKLKLDSRNARIWNNKGLCLTNLSRHEEALSCYDKAIDINPKYLLALRNRSNCLIKLSKYDDALSSIQKTLEIDPTNIIDLNNKVLCENELIKIHEEERRNQEIYNSNLSELIREIENSADVKPCPKCNELEVLVLSLSPNARSLYVRCDHCNCKYRIKMEPDNSTKITQLFNSFLEGRGAYSSFGNDAVPFWQMDIKQRQSINQRKPIPSSVKKAVWKRDGGKCVNCGSGVDIEYDHIIPVARGGSSTIQNIQILCMKCNRKKSASIE